MDILRAKTEQLLVLEDEIKDGALTQKLDEMCKELIRELRGKKVDQTVLGRRISSEKVEHEKMKRNIIHSSFQLECYQQYLGFISSEKTRHEELMKWKTIRPNVQLECNEPAEIGQMMKKKQFKSLYCQLRHKRSNNLGEERAILRELSQLDEIAKGKGKEKADDQEDMTRRRTVMYHNYSMEQIERQIRNNTRYMKSEVEEMKQQVLSKRYRINRLEEEKDVLEKRIKFLERKLARIYSKQRSSK